MGHHDQRGAARSVHLQQQVRHIPPGGRIEISGGLIGQKNRGLQNQGPGNRYSLAFSPGELAHRMLQPMQKPHFLENFPCALAHLFSPAFLEQTGHHYVLNGAELGQKVMELEDKAQETIPKPSEFCGRSIEYVVPAKDHAARGRVIEGSENMQ